MESGGVRRCLAVSVYIGWCIIESQFVSDGVWLCLVWCCQVVLGIGNVLW